MSYKILCPACGAKLSRWHFISTLLVTCGLATWYLPYLTPVRLAREPGVALDEKKRYEKQRWYSYFGAVILLALITTAEVAFYYCAGVAEFLYVSSCLTIGGGVLAWCIYDSLARGLRLSFRFRLWVGLLGPVFVPVYFCQTRGVSRAAKSVFGLALYAPFYATYYGIWYLTAALLTKAGYFSPT